MKAVANWRSSLQREVKRKVIHLTGLFVPAGIVLLGQTVTAALMGLAMSIAIVLEALRLRGNITLPAVRDRETGQVAGYAYYISGSLIAVLVFSPMVAVAAMLMLSLGDTASGLAGSVLRGSDVRDEEGRRKGRRFKPLPVVAAMFATCLIVGWASSAVTNLAFPVYLAGAAGATFADAVPLFVRRRAVDDNFTIPIYSGLAMSLAGLGTF